MSKQLRLPLNGKPYFKRFNDPEYEFIGTAKVSDLDMRFSPMRDCYQHLVTKDFIIVSGNATWQTLYYPADTPLNYFYREIKEVFHGTT